eukprot:8432003-Karenia_brevis.AAC.1
MHAAANKLACIEPSAKYVRKDEWVKAHVAETDAATPGEAFRARGNAAADAAAVMAQTRFDVLSKSRWEEIEVERTKTQSICRLIGALAHFWPAAKEQRETRAQQGA